MEYATDSGKVLFESLWRTRYNNDVPINEMDDEHLINTINYLEQQLQITDESRDEWQLPITNLPRTQHNIEVLKRELIRRNQESD